VIGAIVDRNRLQRAAFARATALGVRAVRLPLAKHLTMDKTHVLTVNHCLELLTRVGHGEGWSEALQRTLPSRKGAEYDDGAAGDGGDGASATAQQAGGSGKGGKGSKGSKGSKESKGGGGHEAPSNVCYQFLRGACTRGAACKFSHGHGSSNTDCSSSSSSTSSCQDGEDGSSGSISTSHVDSSSSTTDSSSSGVSKGAVGVPNALGEVRPGQKRKLPVGAAADPTYRRDMRFL
jgi:hypothetical protein